MSDTQRTKTMAMKILYATVALIFKKNLFGTSLFPFCKSIWWLLLEKSPFCKGYYVDDKTLSFSQYWDYFITYWH